MTTLKENLLSPAEILHLKLNKNLITTDLLDTLRSKGKEGKQVALDILDLFQDKEKYYRDAFGQRISVRGNRYIKSAFIKLKLSDIHKIEIERCKNDINYFMDNYIKIVTPKGVDFPDLRDYQKEFIQLLTDPKVENLISAQGRQSGKTVTTAIWLLHNFLFEKDMNMGVVSQKAKQAAEFLDKVKKMFVTIPIWLQCGITSWTAEFIENESKVRIMTDVCSDSSFRGFSCNYLVVDECAWIKPDSYYAMCDALIPSQSGLSKKKLIMISTVKGKNHFYEVWEKAGETIETSLNQFIRFEVDYRRVPRFKIDGTPYTPEEFKQYIVARNGIRYFEQNYGNSFIGSSCTLINGEVLHNYKSERPIETVKGIKIYESPIEGHTYIMGIDGSKEGKDGFGIQILDITDFKFRQVCSASLQVDYLSMPSVLYDFACMYNGALIVIENNEGSGQSIADTLYRDYEYENMYFDYSQTTNKRLNYPGFRTTPRSRVQILESLKVIAENGYLELIDEDTLYELQNFIEIKGKYQADNGKHDDLVMSLALCFAIFGRAKNFDDYRPIIEGIKSASGSIPQKGGYFIGRFDDAVYEDRQYQKSGSRLNRFQSEILYLR